MTAEGLYSPDVTNEALARMTYLEMCVRETLRMAVGPFGSSRKAMRDFRLCDGRVIPQV
jgi:hypothetical protein